MKKLLIFNFQLSILLAAALVAGCNKEDESPFAGSDNYIAAFTLVKDGVTLKGAISPDAIVITAPERLSLEGATATVTLSENAAVTPDPVTITDWDAAQTFTVTAHNGARHRYDYSVERRLISRDGNVVLLTQADVETFVEEVKDIDQINGSITIGATTGQDTVYSLAGVEHLKVIKGGIIINATYAGEDLTAFENLEKTNELLITSKKVKTVRFPKLAVAHADLNFNQATAIQTLDFPELTAIDKGLRVYYVDSLASLNFPKLQQVEESVVIQGRSSGTQNLQTLNLPALQKVGGSFTLSYMREMPAVNLQELTEVGGAFSVSYLNKAESFAAPKLETVVTFSLSNCAVLTEIDFHALKTTNSVSVSSCAKLTGVSLPALGTANSVTLSSCAALTEIDFQALAAVTASISVSSCAALEAVVFPVLETIGASISVSTCAKLAGLSFPVLTTVSTISMSSCAALEEINFPELETVGTLTLPPSNALAAVRFPALTSATATIIVANVAAQADLQFPLLKTVGNTLRIEAAALTSLDAFAAVETIGSQLYLSGAAALTSLDGLSSLTGVKTVYASGLTNLTEIDLRRLKTDRLELYGTTQAGLTLIGDEEFPGYLYIGSAPSGATDISITAQGIKTVGTLEVYSSYATSISLPWVEQVTGTLTVNGTSIKTIDFSNLQAVGRIYFNGLEAIGTCNFPALKTITQNGFFYQMMTYNTTTIEFPELQSVTGNIQITNPYTNRYHVSTISFPKLATVSGTLSLSGTTNQNAFTDLSGFSALTSAAAVTISNFKQLKHFEPLKNVIPSLQADKWSISGCAYNPTYQDMVDEKYTN